VTDRTALRSATRPVDARPVGKYRLARRSALRTARLVGLGAALAAAAGTPSAGLPASLGTASGGVSATAQLDAITTARIARRDLASRDSNRVDLSLMSARKLQANAIEAGAIARVNARAAKLNAVQAQTERRAVALAAAKAASAAKLAAAAKVAAAEREAAARQDAVAADGMRVSNAVLPVSGYHLTAMFGQGGGHWANNHTGIDFAAPIGTPVGSVMGGVVIAAEYAGAYGRQVQVRHANGTVTTYSHMSAFSVSVGDTVGAGTEVGRIGVTGNTTGPHLHFEVKPGGGDPIDPMPWLRDHGLRP
jgi:murein DD-endopeptidase MepM/ murein hydrolase activator NlpD